ncbi:hypothetical protein [Derxia gummosa]|uniref:PEP-CTERM protein-sorting domain-containing protein n=1 Tax=Derxia gummosa DSM 723 TaxID=1121388 RepID=A0A8B6X9M2_9BURK|nr:hypothetical protein [Derxia gummosa]
MKLKQIALALATFACMGAANAAWTSGNSNGGNGSASETAGVITLVSSNFDDFDAAPLEPSTFSYSTVFAAPGTVSFDWNYATADSAGSSYDVFGYVLDGTAHQLSADGSWDAQAGHVSFNVAAGSSFAFTMTSTDSLWGAATASVSNFTSPVPEADALLMLALGLPLATGAAWRRRRAG